NVPGRPGATAVVAACLHRIARTVFGIDSPPISETAGRGNFRLARLVSTEADRLAELPRQEDQQPLLSRDDLDLTGHSQLHLPAQGTAADLVAGDLDPDCIDAGELAGWHLGIGRDETDGPVQSAVSLVVVGIELDPREHAQAESADVFAGNRGLEVKTI